ncbi:MAG: NADPH-dependent 7-cyano-7-deazaguanine reductase QueF [Firmicutes bacterium]|jgi:7-cyano-7-deazaguanine reductase|nr:NADPH-dependent 7-cyano-7-deazaguanine reductase QueF [Bacillota bacterium]HPU00436.1 preQ(1) synthase [Bacillota bacterium]
MKDDRYAQRRFDVLKPDQVDKEVLETVPFAYPGRRTEVEIIFPEFTSVCPWTGLPDFGELRIKYVPRETCVELKSLKYYLNSYRNVGIIQEDVVNRILDDLTALINPISMTVTGNFNPRGGMKTVVSASYPHSE